MPQPTLQEYQEAIQRPDLCFQDKDLKNGETVPGVFGLPKVISGGFAGVFQVKKNGKSYAARCFLKDVEDIETRYKAIYDFFHRKRIKCIIKFQYIDQGIKVKGKWYPILKMEWLEGQTLSRYIEKNHDKPEAMEDMAQKFMKLVDELKKRGISHGDLHDQNIMVNDNELKLIDYDAMYVPELKNHISSEIGHTNYQHPERTLKDYGPHIDHFSEWVIYTSLKTLAKNPTLWETLDGGDQCLLFRNRDYKDPQNSKAIKALEKINDKELETLVETLKNAIYTPRLEDIPSIQDIEKIRKKQDNETIDIAVKLEKLDIRHQSRDNSWIWDNKQPEQQVFTGNHRIGRINLILTLLYTLMIEVIYITRTIPSNQIRLIATGIPILATISFIDYHNQEKVKQRRNQKSRLRKLEALKKEKNAKLVEKNTQAEKLRQTSKEKIDTIIEEIQSLNNQKNLEQRKTESKQWNNLREIQYKKERLDKEKQKERQTLLQSKKEKHLTNKLKEHRVVTSRITGISVIKRFLLSRNGVKTAADFNEIRTINSLLAGKGARFHLRNGKTISIWWLDPGQINSLRNWRNNLVKKYEKTLPSKLNKQEKKALNKKYSKIEDSFKTIEKKIKNNIQIEKKKIEKQFHTQVENHRTDIQRIKEDYRQKLGILEKEVAKINNELERINWEINIVKHQLKGYNEITFINYIKKILTN